MIFIPLIVQLDDSFVVIQSFSLIRTRKRIIVLNKCDLANPNLETLTARAIHHQYESLRLPKPQILFTSLTTSRNIHKLIPAVAHIVNVKDTSMSTIMMAVGLPNVGKSSVINALRKNAKIPTAGQICDVK
eukprot:c8935_g1_i2.p1 GENE.c8935_g1_i2~~c8935_g1_i2.p1  ORF type:complete len:131 (+),score=24.98 c8935_g1_i2:190-582(+)